MDKRPHVHGPEGNCDMECMEESYSLDTDKVMAKFGNCGLKREEVEGENVDNPA
jgi:hypothetical protein